MRYTLAILLAASTVALTPLSAYAQHRANTNSMTCNKARNIVYNAGGIVLSTGTHTYERFVKSRFYCELNQTIKRQYVPTLDNNRCNIGYKCVYYSGRYYD